MRFCFFMLILMLCSCSTEMIKHLTYETFQNLRIEECQKSNLPSDCNKRQSYDDYQKKLQQTQQSNSENPQ